MQRVEQLAPDAAAVKAAQGVAKPQKWQGLGHTERLLWGECQGSGSNPYQVRVDLDDAACKCSCPSRKQPCKHALGLLMLFAGSNVPTAPMPGFVEEWQTGRAKRAETKATRAAAPEKPPDPQAQARRVEKREGRIDSGLAQLETWIADLVAQGLAAARTQPPQYWAQMAARLVDAQAPGLARRVRDLGDVAVSGVDWQSELLAGLARLQLLIDSYRKLDRLPAALAAEVRTLIGWSQQQDALLERQGVRGQWQVLGHRQIANDQVRTQYTWLAALDSGRIALLLDFAVSNQPFSANFLTGQVADAELVFFDGEPPLRALVKERVTSGDLRPTLPKPVDILGLQERYGSLLVTNPWLETWPVVLGPVTPLIQGDQLQLIDSQGRRVLARRGLKHAWHLEALAGGGPLTVFGLWNGHVLDPITVEHEGRLFSLGHAGELPVLAKIA
jgi:SWIM zinc finger